MSIHLFWDSLLELCSITGIIIDTRYGGYLWWYAWWIKYASLYLILWETESQPNSFLRSVMLNLSLVNFGKLYTNHTADLIIQDYICLRYHNIDLRMLCKVNLIKGFISNML